MRCSLSLTATEYVTVNGDSGFFVVFVFSLYKYYANREKLKLINREDDLEKMNRTALKIAREVATATGTLMAGGLCNTGVYETGNEETYEIVESMFKVSVSMVIFIIK